MLIFVVNNWSRDAGWPVTFWRCVPRALVRGAAWWRHFASGRSSSKEDFWQKKTGSKIKDLVQVSVTPNQSQRLTLVCRDQNQNAKILGFEKLAGGGISPQAGRPLRQMMPGGKSAKSMEEKYFRQSIGQIFKKARWLHMYEVDSTAR